MLLRDERADDAPRIAHIHSTAFTNHPAHAPGAAPVEHRIVEILRAEAALSLSLLAEIDGQAVGHLALSPAAVGACPSGWYLLGPLGVLPPFQGRGIGSALVREALRRLRAQGAGGIVLVGDPGYYERFGFTNLPGIVYPGVPARYVLGLCLGTGQPEGAIAAHAAFRVASA